MKRNLVLSLVLLFVACGIPQKAEIPAPDPYEHLTSVTLLEQCDAPVESYMMPMFGELYFVLRHENCGGVDDLFTIQFTEEMSELQTTVAKLLVILYIRYAEEGLQYEHVKTYEGIGEDIHAVFYRLIKKELPVPLIDNKDVPN